jgi:hypothetical protein
MSQVAERLRISRFLREDADAVFLVTCTNAIRMCARGGFLKVAPSRAIGILDNAGRSMYPELRAFVSRARISPFPPSLMDDDGLRELVRGHIRTGGLVGVHRDGKAVTSAGHETGRQRRLIRDIEKILRSRISVAGRSYKLVADVDLGRVPRRHEYEVVRHDEAVQVLERLAALQAGAGLPNLLREASGKLTRDWRPPISQPDGLILLRHVPTVAAVGAPQAPVTPSQMAKLVAQQASVTLEVVVLGLDDKPLQGLTYVIDAPDAETFEGDLGASAKTKITSTRKGTAGVRLGWSEAEAST